MIKAMLLTVYLSSGAVGGEYADTSPGAWERCNAIAEAIEAQAGSLDGGLTAECTPLDTMRVAGL